MHLGGIDYSRLCRDLTARLIPEATKALKIHIGLDDAISPPHLIVGQTSELAYKEDYRAVSIPSELSYSDDIDLFVSVGEEVMHYLHHQVRPEIFAAREGARSAVSVKAQEEDADLSQLLIRNFIISNYVEAVGQYAGLVFAERNSNKSRVKQYIDTDLAKQISKASKRLNARDFKQFDDDWNALTHMFGYALSAAMYEKDEGSTLRELFFLPPEQFGEVCERYQVQNIEKP